MIKKICTLTLVCLFIHAQEAKTQSMSNAVTLPPDSITPTSARLHGKFTTDGTRVGVTFSAWLTDFPSYTFLAGNFQIFEGTPGDIDVSTPFTGLTPNTTYAYKMVGSLIGNEITFTTADAPRGKVLITPLRIKNQIGYIRTMPFGVHTYATPCIDPSLGEREEPPLPPEPTTAVLARFSSRCFGFGMEMDILPYISPAQIDTYNVGIYTSTSFYPLELSWLPLDSFYIGQVTLFTAFDSVDMKTQTSFQINDPDVVSFRIIAQGPHPPEQSLTAVTRTVSFAGETFANLRSLIYPRNPAATQVWYEWGPTSSYGNQTSAEPISNSYNMSSSEHAINGLDKNSLYHFRAVAQDSNGIVYGSDQAFQTTGVTSAESVDVIPEAFALYQNYPNPFNPLTTIKYALPQRGYVSLKIFNILGQEVATLINEEQDPGYKSVEFETSNLPSGIYTYRITEGSFIDVKKMVVVK